MNRTLAIITMTLLMTASAFALNKYSLEVVNLEGQVYTSAESVTVYRPGTSTIATIWDSAAGDANINNPITSGLSGGRAEFWGDYPYYDLKVTSSSDTAATVKKNIKPSDAWIVYLASTDSNATGSADLSDYATKAATDANYSTKYDSNTPGPTKGGSTIVVSTYDTPLALVLRADYNCPDNNAQTMLETAVAAAGVGGTVVLQKGSYNISASSTGTWDILTSNVKIIGYGATVYQRKVNTATKAIVIGNSGANPVYGVTIKGLSIYEDPANYDTTANYGIYVEASATNTLIEDCNITAGYGGIYTKGVDTKIYRNTLVNVGDESIQIGVSGTILGTKVIDNRIRRNGQRTCQAAIRDTAGVNTEIRGNYISDCNGAAISLTDTNGIVTGNTLINNCVAPSGGGAGSAEILITASATNCIIQGNYIWATTAPYCIDENTPATGKGENVFTDNICRGGTVNTYHNAGNEISSWISNRGDYVLKDRKVENWWNASGSTIGAGAIVVRAPDVNGDSINTTATLGDANIIGMALESIADGTRGMIIRYGKTTLLKVNGVNDISIGNYISAFDQNGIGQRANAGDFIVGRALEAYATNDNSGVVNAEILQPFYLKP